MARHGSVDGVVPQPNPRAQAIIIRAYAMDADHQWAYAMDAAQAAAAARVYDEMHQAAAAHAAGNRTTLLMPPLV